MPNTVNKTNAAKFSFMMSAPAILGSLLMEGKDAVSEGYISEISLVPAVVGIAKNGIRAVARYDCRICAVASDAVVAVTCIY